MFLLSVSEHFDHSDRDNRPTMMHCLCINKTLLSSEPSLMSNYEGPCYLHVASRWFWWLMMMMRGRWKRWDDVAVIVIEQPAVALIACHFPSDLCNQQKYTELSRCRNINRRIYGVMSWLLIAGDTKTDRENYFAEVVVVNELVGERIMHRKELFQLFLFFFSPG